MNGDEVGRIWIEMEGRLREAARKWLRDADEVLEAVDEALIGHLEKPPIGPDSPAVRAGFIASVELLAFIRFQQKRAHRRMLADPKHWVLKGRHLALPTEEGEAEANVVVLPDDRPNPEEEAIRKEAEEAIAALARRMGHDPTWRGEFYRLTYVEGKTIVEAAHILGITEEAAKKKAQRLRKYLRSTTQSKRVRKARIG